MDASPDADDYLERSDSAGNPVQYAAGLQLTDVL